MKRNQRDPDMKPHLIQATPRIKPTGTSEFPENQFCRKNAKPVWRLKLVILVLTIALPSSFLALPHPAPSPKDKNCLPVTSQSLSGNVLIEYDDGSVKARATLDWR